MSLPYSISKKAFMMMLHSLLMFLCLTISGSPSNGTTLDLDDFQDGLTSDGHQVVSSPWKSSEENTLLGTTLCNGQRSLCLAAPFDTHPDWDRVYMDRKVKLDLSDASKFILEVEPDELQPFGAVTLYFRSKGGWFSCYGGFSRHGRQKLVFNKEDYRPEGKPAGWDQVDGIRIAFWQGQSKDGRVTLHRLTVPKPPVLIVAGGAAAKGSVAAKDADPKEAKYAMATAKDFERLASKMQIETKMTDEEAFATLDLASYEVIVLPYNPRLLPAARDRLIKYVEGGGKLFVCYRLDPKLGRVIGFEPGKWKRAPRKGRFAEMRFLSKLKAEKRRAGSTAKDVLIGPKKVKIPGIPAAVKQNSWNLNRAKPVGHHAQVVGTWFDDAGESTGEAALLMSDRGAYLSHIVLDDDPENKARMIQAILGKLSPRLWKELAEAQLEKLAEVGHDSPAQTEAWIKSQAVPKAIAALQKSRRLQTKARRLLNRRDINGDRYHQAVALAREAYQARRKAYLLSRQEPKPGQRRAFWNHSGTGAYQGDWDRTMREMSEAGFNAIFPNMCWGGCAHYKSELLPPSKTYEKYGDQIAQAITAGKKYGVEVHVWKVSYYLSHRTPRKFVEQLRSEKRLVKSIRGDEIEWLCPSHPKNFELERDAMLEVVKKYDVDGVHFDYIRYKSGDYCYCDGCRERFEAASGKKVKNWPQECYSGERKEAYRDWRCGNITRLVKAVHDGVQTINPKVQVSAAVFTNYPSCRASIAQDWLLWAKSGYVDFLCPMDYQPNDLSFENMVTRQIKQLGGAVPLCPGIGASCPTRMTAEQVATQIFLTERLGTAGFTIFNLSAREAKDLFPGFSGKKELQGN